MSLRFGGRRRCGSWFGGASRQNVAKFWLQHQQTDAARKCDRQSLGGFRLERQKDFSADWTWRLSSRPVARPNKPLPHRDHSSSNFTRTTALIVKYWPCIVCVASNRLFTSICSRSDVRMKSDPSGGLPSSGVRVERNRHQPCVRESLQQRIVEGPGASATTSGVCTAPSAA